MLAELYQLSRNLKAQGIDTELSHADFSSPGITSHTTVRAVICSDGNSLALYPFNKDNARNLWTLKKGNFAYFPAIRPQSPIFQVSPENELWERIEKPDKKTPFLDWKNTILQTICEIKDNTALPQNIDKNLAKTFVQCQRIKNFSNCEEQPLAHLQSLSAAYQNLTSNPESYYNALLSACEELIKEAANAETCVTALEIIFGSRKKTRNKVPYVEAKIQLLLDFNGNDPLSTIYTERMARAVLMQLTESNTSGSDICMFTPTKGNSLKSTFPGWSASPVISKPTAPFSKFGATPCNARYQTSDSEALKITTETAQNLVSSLKAATSESRKGINWRPIRNGKFETKNKKKIESSDILIAYPSLKSGQLRWIDPLAKPDRHTTKEQEQKLSRQFETLGQAFIEQLSELGSTNDIKNFIQILCIRQISPGQIQLAYQANPTIKDYKNAIDFWQKSKAGLPHNLRVPIPSSKATSGFRSFSPHLLFPEDVTKLLSHHWIRDGMQCQKLESPPIGVIFDLFLRNSNRLNEIAAELLELTLTRSCRLISAAGNALHRSILYDHWKEFHPKNDNGTQDKTRPDPRYEFSRTLSLIGTLLYIMKSDPKSPNNRAAFLTGHLLAMADELHKQYCIVVRSKTKKGSDKLKIEMPTTLIGNGLIARAGDNPSDAIADLLDRGRIYIGWAKTQTPRPSSKEQKSIAINSALKVLRKFQPLATELASHQINKELSSEERAHLFLGYLSPVLGQAANADENNPNNESN